MEQHQKNSGRFGNWIRTSVTARMIITGTLALILLVPLSFVEDLIRERSFRKQEVMREIGEKWGGEVLFYGPVLQVPYKILNEKTVVDRETKKVYTETTEHLAYAYFFPETLDLDTGISPEEKYYGIYKTSVFDSQIHISGAFSKPDFSEGDIREEHILWDKARILIKISNQKGVSNKVKMRLNKGEYLFKSSYENNTDNYQATVPLYVLESQPVQHADLPGTENSTFSMTLDIRGSKQISFVPLGKETTASVSSDWKTANFFGEFLPYNDNKVHENGFDALWKVLDINRPFPQQYFQTPPDLGKYAFGVNFMIPVDEYQQNERSVKYGFLVIALTFLAFFLIQTMSRINIHPFQYFMIGLALIMFYTLLVSITEHSNFFRAYLISGTSVVLLIAAYSYTILKSVKFPIFILLSLSALYTFIFIIIQLENYALITGSIGLFIILAIVMFISRKIDWENSSAIPVHKPGETGTVA